MKKSHVVLYIVLAMAVEYKFKPVQKTLAAVGL